jgi:zinc protease
VSHEFLDRTLPRLGAIMLVLALLAPVLLAALQSTRSTASSPQAGSEQRAKGPAARTMKIQQVKSPGGIEAWLVEDHNVPLLALRFAFEGGNTQDPAGKEGLANFLTSMMDEGAGDLPAAAFQERVEEIAMRMGFEDGRDAFYGSFETLTANREAAVELLQLAVTRPRFDADAVERMRKQLLANLAFEARDPDKVAGREWSAIAFPGHPYGRPATGTEASISAIMREDLESYRSRVFARDTLKVVAVGDIDAKTLGPLLDRVFGALAPKAQLVPVPAAAPKPGGAQKLVEMNVPQSVAVFGMGAMLRKDPDFIPAYVMNYILGGGGFTSRLTMEVRDKRGLAYSVYSYLQTYHRAGLLIGSVATKNEEIGRSLDVIKAELERMAREGPTAAELENAKRFLTGSYPLRFDTSAKIANQLLAIMQEGLGIDYAEKRNGQIDAVTLADAKRVAQKLLKVEDLIVTVVGKPKDLPGRG